MSSKYWRKREAEALKKYIKDEKKYSRTLNGYYNDMFREVEKEIELFYAKYAKKEKISLAEAKLRISKADIEDFARKAKKYVKEKNFSKQANEEMRLYNATMRINRLEMLKAQIGMELVAGHNDVESEMEQILSDRAQEEATRMAGILGKSVNLDPKTLGNIVNASFHNATFSQRIWTNQSALRDELSRKLQSGIMQGKNPRELARDLRRTFDVNKFNAERLMRTELARVQTDVQMKSFEANGFDAYEFIANENDGKTCAVCKELDGKIFKLKDAEVGENLPPMHPMCRCSTAAAMDDEAYNEWLDGYKEHGLSFEDWKNVSARGFQSGGKNIKGGKWYTPYDKNNKKDQAAAREYRKISRRNDVARIAENSGFSQSEILEIKRHIFYNKHNKYEGYGMLEPDYDMAVAWNRIYNGIPKERDILLLRHELLESRLEKMYNLDIAEAHRRAKEVHDWESKLKDDVGEDGEPYGLL